MIPPASSVFGAQATHAVVAAALVATLGWPTITTRVSWELACVCGVAGGCLLVAILTGCARRAPPLRARLLGRFMPAAALLVVSSTLEEIVWRGFALGVAATEVGTVAACVLSTVGFALAHGESRAVATHLLTGATFGGLLVATGSLAAAIAAHAGYNLAVLALVRLDAAPRPALAGWHPVPVSARPPVVEASRVTKRYGAIEALRGFDLELARGEVVALLGPNGSGKTTAVHVLLGLRKPDSGTVRVLGVDPGNLEARRRLGVALQEMACPPTLRVREVVAFAAAHFSANSAPVRTLAPFGLDRLQRRQIGGLSGGQRRRLAVALAFAGEPALLFLDEPTAGLDLESRRKIWAVVSGFAAEGGTVLLTTHSLEEAQALASRVAVMHEGRVVRTGSARALTEELGVATLEDAFVALTEVEP